MENEKDIDLVEVTDPIDLAECLTSDLELTRELQMLFTNEYEKENPNVDELACCYNRSKTLVYVIYDRLVQLANNAQKLVDHLYK